MSELHCTTCDALISPGSRQCPGCGLQITTQAAPAVYVEGPRFSLLSVAVIVIGSFLILSYAMSSHRGAKAAYAKYSFLSDLQSGQLNTAEAFEARCGQPRSTNSTTAGEELHYDSPRWDINYTVTISGAAPTLKQTNTTIENGKAKSYTFTLDPSQLYAVLGCK